MKQRLKSGFFIVGFVSILLTAMLTVAVLYKAFQKEIFSDLRAHADLIKKMQQEMTDTELSLKVGNVIRVTYISAKGAVIYDTDTDAETMDNHLDRPEVKAALKVGSGYSARSSDTLGKRAYYYAVKLDSGEILRVSREANGLLMMFASAIPVILLAIMAITLICLFLARVFTKGIIAPIDNMARHIENIEEHVAFEELVPFAKIIHNQHQDIIGQMKILEQENMKLQMVMSNIEEGLLLLDKDKNILAVNDSALRMLDVPAKGINQNSILYVSRNDKLISCVDAALKKERKTVSFHSKNRQLQAFANPIVQDDMVQGVVCFLVDVTDMKNSEKMRTEFTANVSHELKTPLTIISGYAELIKLGLVKDEDIVKFSGEIHKNATRMLTLIDDIIKLSRLDENDRQESFVRLNVYDIAKHCKELLARKAEKYHVTCEVEGEAAYITGNHTMIEEIVYNLMDNAIRYNKEQGSVTVYVHNKEDKVQLIVEDTGIGIPYEYTDRVFERFFRVDKSRTKETGGTGLGLAIVKHIVMWHDASIQLKSTLGKGTTITIIFDALKE